MKTLKWAVPAILAVSLMSGVMKAHAQKDEGIPAVNTSATIPAGTVIAVRTIDAIDSTKAATGQTYRASLDEDLLVDGAVIAAVGTLATLKLVEIQDARGLTGRSSIAIVLASITIGTAVVNLDTEIVESSGAGKGAGTARKVGAAAGVGALVGGILGGGRGAALGGLIGSGAGAGAAAASRGPAVTVPAETRLSFTVRVND